MPLSQVSDRIREAPGQVLRAVFGSIGKVLLGADKIRSQVADQLSGSSQPSGPGQAGAAPPPRPAAEPPAGASTGTVRSDTAARPAAGTAKPDGSRWRSLDETGNVRLLDEAEETEQAEAGPTATAAGTEPTAVAEPVTAPEPVAEAEPLEVAEPEPVATPEPAAQAEPAGLVARPPAELAEPEPAELAKPEPAELAQRAPATSIEPVSTEPAMPAGPAGATPAAGAVLPVPGYDELSVASLRARLRFLDPAGVRTLLEYEKAHQGRAAVITMFERRLTKLDEGS